MGDPSELLRPVLPRKSFWQRKLLGQEQWRQGSRVASTNYFYYSGNNLSVAHFYFPFESCKRKQNSIKPLHCVSHKKFMRFVAGQTVLGCGVESSLTRIMLRKGQVGFLFLPGQEMTAHAQPAAPPSAAWAQPAHSELLPPPGAMATCQSPES